jgi:hypothetical protein
MGKQNVEVCCPVAEYKKWYSVARCRSDWRKKTWEAIARKWAKELKKKNKKENKEVGEEKNGEEKEEEEKEDKHQYWPLVKPQ